MARDYMSSAGFIGFTDSLAQQTKEIADQLDGFSKDLKNELGEEVLKKAGEIYLAEEKRILAQKYPNSKLVDMLGIWTTNTKYGKQVQVGYPEIVVKTFPEALVIEFGRPASETAGNRAAKKDSLGRTIGYVQPHSHIRAAIFLKKDAVYKEMARLLSEEIKKRFGGK